ncbi:hypothetical protein FQW43_11150 [Salmonella enterica subsp. enterica serovar Enteritidis]|nr:hypothetical protein [Salmonella enterica subsp. enterica serovar Enteritidis]
MLTQLYSAYLGELYGIAFFQYFAKNYSDPNYREHWQLLTEIEKITAQSLREGLECQGEKCPVHSPQMEAKGIIDAKKWLPLPRNELIKTMIEWVAPYQARYQQQFNRATHNKELYKLLSDHENAIYNYLIAESRHDGTDSLVILQRFIASLINSEK